MSEQVKVARLPMCDFPHDTQTEAHYDGKTTMGPWAYMCDDHWASHGPGRLGTGYGQRLILEDDST